MNIEHIRNLLIMISIISVNLYRCGKCSVWNNTLVQDEALPSWDGFKHNVVVELTWVG